MAYAALISLEHSLNQIILYPDQHPIVHYQRKQIQSLLPKLEYLLEFLEDSSHKSDEKTRSWITRIRDAAYEAQNVVDLYCYETEMVAIRHIPVPKNMDLQNIIQEIDAIESDIRGQTGSRKKEAMNIKYKLFPYDSTLASKNMMVGSEDDFIAIRDKLITGYDSALEFVPIVGSGKPSLAKKIYYDPIITNHFDIRAWAVASRSSSIRNMLLCILDSMKMLSDEMHNKGEYELRISLLRTLKTRRYLVTIYDIWDKYIWDKTRLAFPNDNNGSRILLITRDENVAAYVRSLAPRRLSIRSQIISEMVFNLKYPPELEDQTVTSIDLDPCLEILKLSYDYLPQMLKTCFLYMAHFQKDEEISVSKLIKLWVAEGFLKQAPNNNPEAVAEMCVKELVDQNLIIVSKQNFEGKIKNCRIHDLLLDLCIREANKDEFLCVMSPMDTFQKTPHNHLRLSIHSNTPDLILSDSIPSFSFVRSLLYTGSDNLSSSVFLKFKLLRVLDAIRVAFPNFPNELLELLNLRYISFTCPEHIPASISNLRYLQTLIIHQDHSVNLPVEIWNMTHLRHIEFEKGSWPDPIGTELGIDGSPLVLTNLRTLCGIRNLRFTKDVSERIKYVERLKVCYDTPNEQEGWSHYAFQNLPTLQLLEVLKMYVDIDDVFESEKQLLVTRELKFGFPPSLKELTLGGISLYGDGLSVVACLPNLGVLKLKSCYLHSWLQRKGEFRRLKLLLLQILNLSFWEIEDDYPFPCLEQLIVIDCNVLSEIPHQMGEIPALLKIELDRYNETVLDSANGIRDQHHAMGNDKFEVVLHMASPSIIDFLHKTLLRCPEIKATETLKGSGSIIESIGETKQQKTPTLAPLVINNSWSSGWNHKSSMVGFNKDFLEIKDWITASKKHDQLEVMKIVGMAGTGKTTLARNLFDPADPDYKFGIYIWISVSRTNNVQKVIRGILHSMRPKEDELDSKSIEQLTDILYKILKGEKYLIVLDDVWDIHVWDDFKRSFPDDNTRSRIILTTRLRDMDLGAWSSKVHHMMPLPPDISQTLFCTTLFGEEKCPQELKYAAKHFFENFRGLPLSIVVIRGLLSKVRTKDDLLTISKTMISTKTPMEHLKGILSLGYKYLPLNLRACFRSMIISAEDQELSVPLLIRRWIDEGLVEKTGSKSPEEVAEDFLKDLIDRSLVVVCKENKMGEIETCGIPSIWQEYFVANDPDILQILLSKSNQSTTPKESMVDPPRSYNEEKGISMDMLFNNIYTKNCIRYCSVFPTAFEFTKDILVSLWTAQGDTIAGNDAFIEETCIRCFDILLKVKYIVPTGYDPYGDQIKYKFGDEMHAFLQNHLIQPQVSKDMDSKHIKESKVKHLSLSFKEICQINFEIIKKLSGLQTLIIHRCYGFKVTHLPFDLFLELKALRHLSLSHTDVVELPSSIKSSVALRYLDMSETPIRWLPESMWCLNNLQTLKLDNCLNLIRLPKQMKQLMNLRHLILDVARQLQSMPEGIGNLSELRTLRAFLVGEDDGYSINELRRLNKLSGSLRILKLEKIKTPDQASYASLRSKQDLKKIELQWSDFQNEKNQNEEQILKRLEPPLGIQELKILYYSGGELPSWISKPSFTELTRITLHKCRYCSNLPSLGQLPSLKFLSIVGMNEVQEINHLFCREQGTDENQLSFPVLEELSFDSMSKLEKWTEIRTGDFALLMNLIIESCPKINCLPSLSDLNSLTRMEISYCPELSCLPELPSTLESLMIRDCPNLNERCRSDGGEDWSKIANVPILYIDNMEVDKK